jgi:hypothetical protein
MLKKLVDTNIFIDRFMNPDRFKGLFLSEGLVYLSAVVLMEIRAGAHSKEALKAVQELSNYFKRVERIIVPTLKDYQQVSVTNDMSGFIAHNLSGLVGSPLEVTNETDRDATGEPEDAIRRGLLGVEREPVDAGDSGPGLGGK